MTFFTRISNVPGRGLQKGGGLYLVLGYQVFDLVQKENLGHIRVLLTIFAATLFYQLGLDTVMLICSLNLGHFNIDV